MGEIISRGFSILCDFTAVNRFMKEIYEKDWRNGVPAPFLEYALVSDWMDKSRVHRFRIWEDDGRIVAFVFYENPINHVFFSLRPGYEELAGEMVAYAKEKMPRADGRLKLMIFEKQEAIMDAAKEAGFENTYAYDDKIIDFDKPLEYPLPEGFRFVKHDEISVAKLSECCWKGFNHEEEEGPWDGDYEYAYQMDMAPNFHLEDAVVIESNDGEYACYAGMWWTPENHLAYMEPLCTIPKYRRMGLAAAALSEHYRRMKPKGATHMTGGSDPFYDKIGYRPVVRWTFWEHQK